MAGSTSSSVSAPPTHFDIVVVGAGSVGLTLGVGLALAGFETAVIGPEAPVRPGRTVAMLDGSIRLLERFDLWRDLLPRAAPLRAMRIVDATNSLFRSPPVTFRASDIGLPMFGRNIENAHLDGALAAAAERVAGLTRSPTLARAFSFEADQAAVTLAGGEIITASLLVAADGRESLARKSARIGVRQRSYPQVALTTHLTHRAPHEDISTEFHTREGPFTLVPLPSVDDASYRSSLVWVMSPREAQRRRALPSAALRAEIEAQSQRILGSVTSLGPVGAFPIATSISHRLHAHRLALVGEAGHALPPIGAQGLNLSFRDVEAFVDILTAARSSGEDWTSAETLSKYERIRQADVGLRALGVDTLNSSLLSRSPVTDLLRGLGLQALQGSGPLRRWVMRQGLAPDAPARLAGRKPRLDATNILGDQASGF